MRRIRPLVAAFAGLAALALPAVSARAQDIPAGQSCGGLLCDVGVLGHKVDPAPPPPPPVAPVVLAPVPPPPIAETPREPPRRRAAVRKPARPAVVRPVAAHVPAVPAPVAPVATAAPTPPPAAPTPVYRGPTMIFQSIDPRFQLDP